VNMISKAVRLGSVIDGNATLDLLESTRHLPHLLYLLLYSTFNPRSILLALLGSLLASANPKKAISPDMHICLQDTLPFDPGSSVSFGEVSMSSSGRGPLAFIVSADVTLRIKRQRRSQQPTAIQQGGHYLGVLESLRNFVFIDDLAPGRGRLGGRFGSRVLITRSE
jgi:hypothetical protein